MAMTNDNADAANRSQRTEGSAVDSVAKVHSLRSDALNAPNLITVSRLVLAVILFVLIDMNGYWITAAILFVFAAATDALDGYIARKYEMVTALGRILDPFVDKIIVCGAFIFLLDKRINFEDGGQAWSGVNAWMVIIVVGREMFVTSLRGYLEKQGRDFSASMSGKLKMVIQCMAVTGSLLSLSPLIAGPTFNALRDFVLWGAVAITVWSGVVYIYRAREMLRVEPDA